MQTITKLKLTMGICLVLAVCFTGLFILEYKNSLDIDDRHEDLQAIESSTDIMRLKQTAKMRINFLHDVHRGAISLWKVSLIYGGVNIILLTCCVGLLKSMKHHDEK
jgi:hypothetical protein